MNLRRKALAAILWLAASAIPSLAQLDRVVAEAVPGDIDCLPCAVTIEAAMKQVPGVDKVAISMSKQMVAITFHEGARFTPKLYREAIGKADVRVQTFHVAMRGTAEQVGDQVYFVSGQDRFLIPKPPADLAIGKLVGVMAVVDDLTEPPSITSLDDIKPL